MLRSFSRAALLAAAALLPLEAVAQSIGGGVQPSRRLPDTVEPEPLAPEGEIFPRGRVPDAPATPGGGARFMLEGVSFEGNTVLSDAELTEVVAPLVGRQVSIDEVEQARRDLTQAYIDRGYVNSGVIVPDQDVADGVLRFRVIEGRLTEVRVRGEGIGEAVGPLGDLHPDFVRNRLALDPEAPFALSDLEERFRLLLSDPSIGRLDGALSPGRNPGEAVLDVEVTKGDQIEGFVGFDNFDPPSTGEWKGVAGITLRNSTGFGDALSLSADVSRGRQALYSRFSMPVTADGLSVFAEFEASQTDVIEEPFASLEIASNYARSALGASYDVVRTGTDTFTMDAMLDFKNSKTFLFGEPFSFSEGVEDGTSRATVLRFGQQYLHRGAEQAYSLRSVFSVGLNVFDATENGRDAIDGDTVADGQFASWLGQGFYVRRFEGGVSASARLVAQVAFDELLPFEQVELGGADTVRGYNESAITADSFLFGRFAVNAPIYRLAVPELTPANHTPTISIEPFVTAGTAWDYESFDERATLMGIGLDMLWSPSPSVDIAIGFGTPIVTSVRREGSSFSADAIEDTRAYITTRVNF